MDKNVNSVNVTPRPCRSSFCEGAFGFLVVVTLEEVVVVVLMVLKDGVVFGIAVFVVMVL